MHAAARDGGAGWRGRGRDRDQCNQRPLPHPTQAQGWEPPVLCSLIHLFLGWPLHPSGLYPRPNTPAWLEPTLMEARSHRSIDI